MMPFENVFNLQSNERNKEKAVEEKEIITRERKKWKEKR